MAKNIKGITIEIGGNVQPLNKALEGVNKTSKDLQAELRQVDRLLKLDPKNTELMAQKQKLLGEAVSNTKTKLDTLKGAQKQVEEQFRRGEVGEEQYRALQREIVNTEQNLKGLERQLSNTHLNLDKLAKGMKNAGKKMSTYVTAPLVAAGGVAFKFGADLEDAMGATDQIFGDQSDAMQEWADNLESYYGIAKVEALTYGNTMGSMLQNIGGLTEEEAAKQSQTLIALAGDLTAMFGGTTEDAVRALTGALKGNNTMLDNYGMAVNDAMVKTKAMEMGLYDGTGQMDLAAKQAATLALIMEQTGDAQGQAAREADGASGTMRALITELKNVAAELGQVLLPIITPLIGKIKDVVQWFSNLSPAGQKTIVVIAGIAAAIGPVLTIIGTFISVVKGLIALKKVWAAVQGALNVVLNANPIGLVVIAIAALIAIIVLVIKYWDEIVAVLKAGWDWISGVFQKGWEAFADFWSGIWEGIKDTAINIWDKIIGFFTKARDKIVGIFDKVKDGIVGIWQGIWDGIKGFVNKIIGGINTMIRGMNKLKFDIPDWVPLIGGKTWGINIPQIPKLHTGTDYFTPPNGMEEGLAILKRGEQVIPPGQSATSKVEHTGTIRIEGVNDAGQLVAAADMIIEGLGDPRARLQLDRAQSMNLAARLSPRGAY